jgi:excisionase family DNA binding protein
MFLQAISPTEETQKAIDERASMGAIGDMQKYLQYSAAKAMRESAQGGGAGGEAGSLTSAGVGLGAGVGIGAGMAGMIGQAMAGAQTGAQQAAAGAAAAAVPDVMTLAEAASYLKVSEADVQGLIDGGEIKAKKIGTSFRISKKVLDDFLTG